MCKLISKCCVCGTVYGMVKTAVNGQADDAEKISHGYCSEECKKYEALQVLAWDSKLGIFVGDIAYSAGNKIYYRGEFLNAFIEVNGSPIMAQMRAWDDGFYDIQNNWYHAKDRKSALKDAKAWAQSEEMVIVL